MPASAGVPKLALKVLKDLTPHRILGWTPENDGFLAWERGRDSVHQVGLDGSSRHLCAVGARDAGRVPVVTGYDARRGLVLLRGTWEAGELRGIPRQAWTTGGSGNAETAALERFLGTLPAAPYLSVFIAVDRSGRIVERRAEVDGVASGWTLPAGGGFLIRAREGDWALLAPEGRSLAVPGRALQVDCAFGDPRPVVSVVGGVFRLDFARGTAERLRDDLRVRGVSFSRTRPLGLVVEGTEKKYERLTDLEGRDWTDELLSQFPSTDGFHAPPLFSPRGDLAAVLLEHLGQIHSVLFVDAALRRVLGRARIATRHYLLDHESGRGWSSDGSRFALWRMGTAWIVEAS